MERRASRRNGSEAAEMELGFLCSLSLSLSLRVHVFRTYIRIRKQYGFGELYAYVQYTGMMICQRARILYVLEYTRTYCATVSNDVLELVLAFSKGPNE
jgi:hypothetical protein